MTCRNHHDVIVHPPTPLQENSSPSYHANEIEPLAGSSSKSRGNRLDKEKIINYNRNFEGSGEYPADLEIDAEYNDVSDLELEPSILETIPARINNGIKINITVCVCQYWVDDQWSRTLKYPDLSCAEVNNMLPVYFVASCVLSTVGAILSSMVLYLLWTSRGNIYSSAKPSEVKPFIFTSNLKKNATIDNGRRSDIKNGDALYR